MNGRERRLFGALGAFCCVVALSACDNTPVTCDLDDGDPRRQEVETLCDGVDNDCDGVTDVLAPVVQNVCTVADAKGACAQGYSVCVGKVQDCLVPPPVAESANGIDDDCDGVVDDLGPGTGRPLRARVMMPGPVWDDSLTDPNSDPGETLHTVVTALEQAGIPFDAVKWDSIDRLTDWSEAFYELEKYDLLIMPGWVEPGSIKITGGVQQLKRLRDFIEAGGTLVWFKPLGPEEDSEPLQKAAAQEVLRLAGAVGHVIHKEATRVAINGAISGGLYLNALEERDVQLKLHAEDHSIETLVYKLDPGAKVEVFGMAMQGDKALGPTMLRNRVGKGLVYTMGFDPGAYTRFRCYVNCFDPGRDVLTVLLRGLFREAGGGHVVWKHTVPGVENGVFIPSHDIDAPDSHNDGAWGRAGAVRMAEMERDEGVKGTYFITTDFVTGYYNPKMIHSLCELGMCPQGGHSIQHKHWTDFPKGKCGDGELAYDPKHPTICSEVALNLKLIADELPTGTRLSCWRTPYLELNPYQFDVLASHEVLYDSSLGVGDVRTSFPAYMGVFPWSQDEAFHHNDMYEFPLNLEDGMGWYDKGEEQRMELTERTWGFFRGLWRRTLLENAANGAWVVMLIHPSMGVGPDVTYDNIDNKINAVRWAIRFAKSHDIRVGQLAEMGDFWRARRELGMQATYDAKVGYQGTLKTGAHTTARMSLAFSDHIETFECAEAGPVEIKGGRVVFTQALAPNRSYAFTAKIKTQKP